MSRPLTVPQERLLARIRRNGEMGAYVYGSSAGVARRLEELGLVSISHDRFGNKYARAKP